MQRNSTEISRRRRIFLSYFTPAFDGNRTWSSSETLIFLWQILPFHHSSIFFHKTQNTSGWIEVEHQLIWPWVYAPSQTRSANANQVCVYIYTEFKIICVRGTIKCITESVLYFAVRQTRSGAWLHAKQVKQRVKLTNGAGAGDWNSMGLL